MYSVFVLMVIQYYKVDIFTCQNKYSLSKRIPWAVEGLKLILNCCLLSLHTVLCCSYCDFFSFFVLTFLNYKFFVYVVIGVE